MNIVIVIELKNREYDNSMLLKTELESRGYNVSIKYKSNTIRLNNKKSIILIPNCYTTEDFNFYYYTLNGYGNIFINLQYEQLITNKWEEIGFHIPKGRAKEVVHLCWGEKSYNDLLQNGIELDKLKITGAIQLDFLKNEFDRFYFQRDELSKKYGIPYTKKWMLYISSFAYVNNANVENTEKLLKNNNLDDSFVRDYKDISIESQKLTLVWFQKLLEEKSDIVVIYRPHPLEKENPHLKKITEKFNSRFHVISDHSVKQWILVSDIVTTWISTSIVECFVAKKECYVLRPYKVPEKLDITIYPGGEFIEKYEQFLSIFNDKSLKEKEYRFPLDVNMINNYYDIDDTPSYVRISNTIEEIRSSNNGICENGYFYKRWIYIIKRGILLRIILKNTYKTVYKYFKIKIKFQKLRAKYSFSDWEDDVVNNTDSVLNTKLERIRKIIK